MEQDGAVAYITRGDWRESRLGLERMHTLLEGLGNPQDSLRFVHVAGTNGKGSVCAMLASILTAAGCRTGLYTSPFIQRFNERVQMDGVPISDAELDVFTDEIRQYADTMEDHPTEFELVTALGFLYFARKGCDVVVLEVGLGGRLDATNIIGTPELAVITSIGLDHTAELGDSLPAIAGEKAGIIKSGGDVVLYPQPAEVEAVFRQVCEERGARPHSVRPEALTVRSRSLAGQVFSYEGEGPYMLPLLGEYQPMNAAVALLAVKLLRQKGWDIPKAAVDRGLATVRWPARFELLANAPAVVLDGGHNPQGVEALVRTLEHYFTGRKYTLLMGVMADKNHEVMVEKMAPLAERVICVAPENLRSLEADALADEFRRHSVEAVEAAPSVEAGLERVMADARADDVVCAFGSLYLAGQVRNWFEEKGYKLP